MDALKTIAADSLKAELPKFNIGDTSKVGVNIREGEKERVQMFEGTVIAKKALDKGITTVVFDRGGFIYQGKIKALADAAREAGLTF